MAAGPGAAVAPDTTVVVATVASPTSGLRTNTYLVGREEVAIVDPGPDAPEHVDAVLAAARGRRIGALLVSHSHWDHLPAAYRLRERTGAPLCAHPAVPGVDRPLRAGGAVAYDGGRLLALETPGHTADHLCFWEPSRRLLFTGDLVAGRGTIALGDQPGALTQYLDSLRALLELGPSTILPGHGPLAADGRAKLREYLDHRANRERQLLGLLAAGPATVEQMVARLYADTPPTLLRSAARNVRAHLELLAERGQIRAEPEVWHRRA